MSLTVPARRRSVSASEHSSDMASVTSASYRSKFDSNASSCTTASAILDHASSDSESSSESCGEEPLKRPMSVRAPEAPAVKSRAFARRALRQLVRPVGAGATFRATVTRELDAPIGLDVDIVDGVAAVIVDIGEGAVRRWNQWHPEVALRPNDRIVGINGTTGNGRAIAIRLMNDAVWELTVQRPAVLTISVPQVDSPTFGLRLRPVQHGKTLVVTEVGEGPMQEWNREHPESAVRKHDRVTDIRCARGAAARLRRDHLAGLANMVLVVLRYP